MAHPVYHVHYQKTFKDTVLGFIANVPTMQMKTPQKPIWKSVYGRFKKTFTEHSADYAKNRDASGISEDQ